MNGDSLYRLNELVSECNWSAIKKYHDTSDCCNLFISKISEFFDIACLLRTIKTKKNRCIEASY